MTQRLQLFFFFMLTMTYTSWSIQDANGDDFWQKRISEAVTLRNEAFAEIVPESAGIAVTSWSPQLRHAALQRIPRDNTLPANPWHEIIRGLLSSSADPQIADHCFTTALNAGTGDPGTTWLLFVEFNRYDLDAWSEKTLAQLEKQMFESGGRSSQTIASQLLHIAQVKKMAHQTEDAVRLFSWVHRFNPSETASIIRRAQIASLLNPVDMMKTFAELLPVVTTSWNAQLELFGIFYEFARRALFIAIILIVALFAIKHLPSVLHAAAHWYPDRLSSSVRTLLVFGVLVTFAAFGIIPFIWFLSIILWRKLSRPERLLLGGALTLLALSPLDASMMERLDRLRNPSAPLMRLSKALDEGIQPSAASPVNRTNSPEVQRREKAASSIVGVLDKIKANDRRHALQDVNLLVADFPGDPVIANLQGIIHVLDGSFDSAAACFKTILSNFPRDVPSTFNLSHCTVMLNDATTGMELLKKAARLQPVMVNSFIKGNDLYFSGNWPPLRSIMFPDYSPGQFWKWFFIPSPLSPSDWHDYWGLAFFGIPPEASLGIFFALLIGLILSQQLRGTRAQPRRQFECKYCGQATCRRCSAGIICASCADKTIHLKGSRTFSEIIEQIINFAAHHRKIRMSAINLFVPGAGILLKTDPSYPKVITGIVVSSTAYTCWYTLFHTVSVKWLTPFELFCALALPLFFHLWCIIFHLPATIRHTVVLLRPDFLKERSADGTQRHPA